MVSTCNNAIGDIVREHGGKVIKEIGDAVMASFDDCVLSVKSAIKMQQAIYADSLTNLNKIAFLSASV